jgi:hypothetical protein
MTATRRKALAALSRLGQGITEKPQEVQEAYYRLLEFVQDSPDNGGRTIYRSTKTNADYEIVAPALGLGALREALLSDLVVFRNLATRQVFALPRAEFEEQMRAR